MLPEAGSSTRIHYKNHVEAVLVTSGSTELRWMGFKGCMGSWSCFSHTRLRELLGKGWKGKQAAIEGFAVFKLEPGSFYGLGGQECHVVRASPNGDLCVSCAFNPPVDGAEDHNAEGVYPAIGADGVPRYGFAEAEVPRLFCPPDSLKGGSQETKPALPLTLQTRHGAVVLKHPCAEDGASMWSLAQSAGLDANSAYCYIIHCMYFPTTCMVAKTSAGRVVGFVLGFTPPAEPDTYFAWQIAVDSEFRRCRLALTMLEALRQRVAARFVTASATLASATPALLASLAAANDTSLEKKVGWLPEGMFPATSPAPPETLYVVGPLGPEREPERAGSVPGIRQPSPYATRGSQSGAVLRVHPVVWPGHLSKPLSQALLNAYEEQGFCILRAVVPREQIEACHKFLDGQVKSVKEPSRVDASCRLVTEAGSSALRSIFAVHEDADSPVAELATSPLITQFARQVLADDVYIHQSRVNLQTAFKGAGFSWHSDFETWHAEDGMPCPRSASVVVYLDKNVESNGALMVVPGSHKSFLRCRGRQDGANWEKSLQSQAQLKKWQKPFPFLGQVGGTQLFRTPMVSKKKQLRCHTRGEEDHNRSLAGDVANAKWSEVLRSACWWYFIVQLRLL
ncbi:ectD [Symbiodinium natans]|uniref:EctD protein n=1 Tax=Symbiodinium natans TaxID=878477 RepID=A0A812Q2N8_9DINO|nr:ectD [Symbiodinium natans]